MGLVMIGLQVLSKLIFDQAVARFGFLPESKVFLTIKLKKRDEVECK